MDQRSEDAADDRLMQSMESLRQAFEVLIEQQNLLIDHLVIQKQALEADFVEVLSSKAADFISEKNVVWFDPCKRRGESN